MPGIFGFTHFTNNEATRKLFDSMAIALLDDSHYQSYKYSDNEINFGRVGLSIIQPYPQPAWNERGTVGVVMEGEIYDYDIHRSELENKGHTFNTNGHAELFSHYYEQEELAFIHKMNGAFSAAIWDKSKHQLTIINDHLGLHPLYYAFINDQIVFASGIRSLLVHPNLLKVLDHLAIAEFLTFDHLLNDRTLLQDVKLLQGGSTLTFADGNCQINRYWQPEYPEFYPVRSETDYQHELLHLLRKAIIRQGDNQHSAAILMSGGLDSRVIAALLREQFRDKEIKTFTMGMPGCDDEQFAKEVSEQLEMPHHFYTLKGDYLRYYAEQGIRLSDGMGNVVHMHTLPNLVDQSHKAKVIYKGFLGDALIGYGITNRLWANYDKANLPLAHFAVHRDQGLILFNHKDLDELMFSRKGDIYSQQVMESYAKAIHDSSTTLPADQRNYFDLCQRVPRMTINGVEWVRSQTHVRLPFADKELVEFLLSVPPGYRYNRKIIKDLFINQFPELAKIPYTETNYPLVHCRREVTLRAKEQIRWYLRSLGLKWVSMPTKKSYARYNEWLRSDLRPWMENILLSKRTFDRGIFEPEFIKSLVNEHLNGQKHYTRIGVLISIELWLRQFIDGKVA